MKRAVAFLGAMAVVVGVLAVGPAGGSTDIAAVADMDAEYIACGRVFPDPHAYWPSTTQAPNQSPWAKGNAPCRSIDFLPYTGNPQGDMVSGMTYLETLFPQFVEFQRLEQDFGTNINCATTVDPQALCSAGLPRLGTPVTERTKSDMYLVRVTDENVPNTNKKYFVFPLSIHGIERAGAEAGVRAAEDLATWGWCEARSKGEVPPYSNMLVNDMICPKEGAIPHPLLEAQPANSLKAGEALKQSVIYFIFPNPDGWRRGDPDNIVRALQRKRRRPESRLARRRLHPPAVHALVGARNAWLRQGAQADQGPLDRGHRPSRPAGRPSLQLHVDGRFSTGLRQGSADPPNGEGGMGGRRGPADLVRADHSEQCSTPDLCSEPRRRLGLRPHVRRSVGHGLGHDRVPGHRGPG